MSALYESHNSQSDKPLSLPAPYPEHVEEFQQLYVQHFGVRLSTKQATEQLMHLLAFVRYQRDNAEHKARHYRVREQSSAENNLPRKRHPDK